MAGALDELLSTLDEMLLALLDTPLAVWLAVSLEQAEVPRTATAVRPAAASAR
ncbi:hypothetical protein MMAD_22240 [Mycolicibacterium madagascariense]|jgi:hypothetical protein|uniref:Uncharacterized protein n=1 Tax=Mycolicibacterium madagascariense TaxID=212765 RepID=A0A7I7XFG8_9MYCO|nr:hypothetical protein MMAD_22240 [Mycolicibacterium madagascariense]